jgi:hypothetical protein
MSSANPLWGAPRIHGELLKLGIEVSGLKSGRFQLRERLCHLCRIDQDRFFVRWPLSPRAAAGRGPIRITAREVCRR